MLRTGGALVDWDEVDPFDLPDWLGTQEVTWTTASALRAGAHVAGELTSEPGADAQEPVGCDLVAVDEAYPEPIADEELRRRAHQAWRRGEVYLLSCAGRLTLALPGSGFDADLALEAVGRLARALGAPPASYAVRLRIGRDGR